MVVRHGETVANVEHVYQGQSHGELNDKGIVQAYELKEALMGQSLDIIFCSDLKRAVDTAEIIAGDRDVEVVYDKRLRERFLGELQGKKIDDSTKYCDFGDLDCGSERVCNSLHGAVCNGEDDGVGEECVGIMGVEPIEEMFNRVNSFVKDIREIAGLKGYKNILVVSHGITINVFKAISLGEGVEELKGYTTASNCSLQVMEF